MQQTPERYRLRSIAAEIRGILLDIEGTTTPIDFVHDVLFSYARSRVRDYLTNNYGSADLLADLAKLREEHQHDSKENLKPPELVEGPLDAEIASFVAYINWLIDRDRKSTGLKSLQGKIWKEGYLEGTLTARVFPDVALAFNRWTREGMTISIFSSGSALAQKLLFAHTDAGDLTSLITNYFDTTVGSKTSAESYQQIAKTLSTPAIDLLFISDVVDELAAARAARMQTLLCVRPGNQSQSSTGFQIIRSFDDI